MRRRGPLLLAAAAVAVLAADQVTKAVALATLELGDTTPVIDGVLHWTLQFNPGAAFGVFQRLPVLFTILAIAIVIVIVSIAPRVADRLTAASYGLILGGALGNLGDRLFRDPGPFRGHVVDFIDFRVWPVFNIADAAIVVGAGLAVIATLRGGRERPAAHGGEPSPGERPAAGDGDG